VPISVVVFVLGAIWFEESRDTEARALPDLLGAVLIVVGVGAGILALVESPTWGWVDTRTIGALVVSAVASVWLVVRSGRHPAPILEVGLFRYRTFALLNVASFVIGIGWFGMYLVLIQFLRNTWGFSLLGAAAMVTPIPFGAGVFGPLGGRIADRVGYRPMLLGGGAAFGIGSVWFLVTIGDTTSYWAWFPGIIAIAIGTGLVFPSVQGGTVVGMPADRYAVAVGVNQTVQRIGSAIGNALAISFIAAAGIAAAFDRIFVVMLVAAIAIVVSAFALSAPRTEVPASR
jgi:predicted MFS family arabinose efflux permease